MSNFKLLDKSTEAGFNILEMTEGEFSGVRWSFGAIKVAENEDDTATLSYDCNIESGQEFDEEKMSRFNKATGDILVQILEEQLEKSEAVYSGGTE